MKVLSIIYSFLLTICLIGLTMWQIAIESPTFVICMFFALTFGSIIILCKVFAEYYETKV